MISATESPKNAARLLAANAIAQGYKPEALHEYRAADGSPIYWRIRAKRENGEKWIRPMRLNGHGYELGEPDFPKGKKPLYRLDCIAADTAAMIWIVEGEKPADALTKLRALATTSGSATSAADADWGLLAGRECRIFPDNDDAGKAYAGEVANILTALGCRVSCVDVDKLGLPPKGDAWDWLQSNPHATLSDLAALPVLTPSATRRSTAAANSEGPKVVLIRGGDVTPEAITWLWKDWIARGKLHILAGPPGTGKTTLTLALSATITIGGRWPDGSRAAVGDVVIWSGEDGISDTLLPRLLANGADRDRVQFVRDVHADGGNRMFDPAIDTPALALALSRMSAPPAVLIVDPIVSAVAGDSHKNTETRRSLQPLVELGERIGCAIFGISHFSKGTAGRDPVERVTGSIAFGALARVVMAAVKTTNDDGSPGPRLFARAKSNNGPDGGGFHYLLDQVEVVPGVMGSRVLWGKRVEGEAQTLLATAELPPDGDPDARTATDEACEWLRNYLSAHAKPAVEVMRDGHKIGLSDKVLRRAKERIGVSSKKGGMDDGWEWSLSPAPKMPLPPEDAEDAQQKRVGAFDAFVAERASSGDWSPAASVAAEEF